MRKKTNGTNADYGPDTVCAPLTGWYLLTLATEYKLLRDNNNAEKDTAGP